MCEIIVIDPSTVGEHTTLRVAKTLLDQQGDGLGVLAVYDRSDSFEYEAKKSVNPHWMGFFKWMRRCRENDVWRFVIHARAATHGTVNRENCHPIRMDEESSDVQFVVHNGSVSSHKTKRNRHIKNGHHYNTDVDSEVIGHEVGNVPSAMDDVETGTKYNMHGMLNYLLFSEDSILIHNDRSKYYLTEDFTMTCRNDLNWEGDDDIEWMVLTPGGEAETKEQAPRSVESRGNVRTVQGQWPSPGNGNPRKTGGSGGKNSVVSTSKTSKGSRVRGDSESLIDRDGIKSVYDINGKLTVTYEDQYPESDHMCVYNVAPGVLVLMYNNSRNPDFIFRQEKKTYYDYLMNRHSNDDDNDDDPEGNAVPVPADEEDEDGALPDETRIPTNPQTWGVAQ